MKHWYAVYTKASMELWARTNLWERDYEVYLPMVLKRRRHARRTDTVSRPLFPRYLFVHVDLDAGVRRIINGMRGVTSILCYGDSPSPIPEVIIDEIQAREAADGYIDLVGDLNPGDGVRVVKGAFCDQVGLFDRITDQQRVIILLNVLGRSVKARVAAQNILPESD